MRSPSAGVRFRERAIGVLACGLDDRPVEAFNGLRWLPISVDIRAHIPDIRAFLDSPDHRVGFEHGIIESGHFGRGAVTDVAIDLLVGGTDDDESEMRYRFCFTTDTGNDLTLFGYKDIKGSRFRVWYDTTRIFVELYHGRLASREDRRGAVLAGVGVLEIPLRTFLAQLTTIRPAGRPWGAALGAYAQFLWFFSSNLALPYWRAIRRRRTRDPEPVLSLRHRDTVLDWARMDVPALVPTSNSTG